jgi:hypothetical protein
MGLLDDAIREHLDLKRRRGADPAEIEKAEREALGPVRREPGASAYADAPVGRQPEPAGAPRYEEEPGFDEGPLAAPESYESEEAPAERRHRRRGLLRRGRRETEYEDFDHRYGPEDPAGFEPGFDDEHDDFATLAPEPSMPLEPTAPDPALDERAVGDDSPPPVAASPVPAAPRAPDASAPPAAPARPDRQPPASDDDLLDETAVHDVVGDGSAEPSADTGDVLEETPEFLQDTPDHDRLWFEQRPPRDFDFDG